MECKECNKEMKLVYAWDDAQKTDHAFNLYVCEDCGIVCKIDVWEDKGVRWIDLQGNLTKQDE